VDQESRSTGADDTRRGGTSEIGGAKWCSANSEGGMLNTKVKPAVLQEKTHTHHPTTTTQKKQKKKKQNNDWCPHRLNRKEERCVRGQKGGRGDLFQQERRKENEDFLRHKGGVERYVRVPTSRSVNGTR